MKIAWFTPFHAACGPGFMAYAVVQHLTNYFDVEVFYTWHPNAPNYEIPGVVCHPITEDLDLRLIAQDFDAIFYNLGNNEENHYHILSALRRQPGIPILHDYVMQHAFVTDIFVRKEAPDIYYWLLTYLYGEDGIFAAQETYSMQRNSAERIGFWDSTAVARFPFYELAAKLGTGCVVHSRFFESALEKVFPGPVLRTRNPVDLKKVPSKEVIDSFYSIREHTDSQIVFSCFGHMSPNKCIDRVIRAFGLSDTLRKKAKLVICGGATEQYQAYLDRLIDMFDLNECVEFRGKVTDNELYALQVESDVFVNLRNPNTEGQSGSLIEQMAAGKPVVCFNTGCYQDVPANAAFKIADVNDLGALIRAFEEAATNPSRRRDVGLAGREYAMEYDCARYAREIFEFVFKNRDYLKSMQTGSAPKVNGLTKSQQAKIIAHLEVNHEADAAWRILEQQIEPESDLAFSLLPEGIAQKFASFLQSRNRPVVDAMQSILAWDSDAVPRVTLAGYSRFAIPHSPLLDLAFWSEAEKLHVEEFVPLCYQKILCREADPTGVKRYVDAIKTEGLARREFIRILLQSNEATTKFDLSSQYAADLLQWCEAA